MNEDFSFCLLAQVSLSIIISDSTVFLPIRNLFIHFATLLDLFITYKLMKYSGSEYVYFQYCQKTVTKLLTCSQCVSFWVGLIWGGSIVNGLVVSLLAYIIGITMSYIKVLDKVERENM